MNLYMDTFIEGIKIDLREAEISDAEFMLNLRLDEDLNKHIFKIEDDLEKQRKYIQNCKDDPTQIYFMIENKNKEPMGMVRLHNFTEDTFTLGSLIVRKDVYRIISIESIFLALAYGYKKGLKTAVFSVKKANKKVASIYNKLVAKFPSEDEENFYYEVKVDEYNSMDHRFYKYMKYTKI